MQDRDDFPYLADYIAYCNKLKDKTLFRKLTNKRNHQITTDFSTNDYLSLSKNCHVIDESKRYAAKWGTSSSSSRLIDNPDFFIDLEKKIAKTKNTEDALILNSGFTGNVTVLAALLDKEVFYKKPIVFSDRLIHSSMHLAIQISGVSNYRYRHLDLNHLEDLLQEHKNYTGLKFILSETIFSMDGDIVDIEGLISLSKKYNAFLYLDEAHDIGMLGKHGYGLSTKYSKDIGCVLGSFSKAVGAFGGYIACSTTLKEYLVNKCKGVIYSVALPPSSIGAASKSWDIIPTLDDQRAKITKNSQILTKSLRKIGLNVGNTSTHIVPIILKDSKKTLELKEYLNQNNIAVSAIRPPSVSPNTSRIKISVCSEHRQEDIDNLVKLIEQYELNH